MGSPPAEIPVTTMRFWVSVPVLSEQITVAQPSVSTLARSLTMALRLAMRDTPMASDRVTVGMRPSGTLATKIPMQNTKACTKPRPATSQPSSRNTTPMASARPAIAYTVACSCLCSGLASVRIWAVRVAIRPISVDMPVPKTTALQPPLRSEDPANRMFGSSIHRNLPSSKTSRSDL
jgi:hypothetical protein